MDGRVLVEAFEQALEIKRIPSWETVPGFCGMHPAGLRVDAESGKALIEQFAALGYIQQHGNDAEAVAGAVRENKFNLARAHMDARNANLAIPLLEELVLESPKELRFHQHLAQCYVLTGQSKKAKLTLEQIAKELPADGPPHALSDWMMGVILNEEGGVEMALDSLRRAEAAGVRSPGFHIRLGVTYLQLSQTNDASRAFEKALELDDENPQALIGLSRVRLAEKRNEEAAGLALCAVGLQHYLPAGHYYLGVALMRLRDLARAILAFETAVAMAPGMADAHRRLGVLHSKFNQDSSKGAEHLKTARALRRQARA